MSVNSALFGSLGPIDADRATEQLLLVRLLPALGLGPITEILHGQQSIDQTIATESARLDVEFRSLARRRASLRAVRTAPRARRAERLALPLPPADPSVQDVVAWAELTAIVTDPEMNHTVRQQLWRSQPELIRDRSEIHTPHSKSFSESTTGRIRRVRRRHN
ncbi:hypothetical protein K7711_07935 [Nocardia sp. CA2R105]|uniref:hypothetical protein n=1 Tax=Nocardia coffeae TaxID=2873381 RepID=UPI001CA66C6E|nr:hypothetical protein [Nocardia coffeae]MBY8856402.1 hypothetical protein [Nocardia coffeae]